MQALRLGASGIVLKQTPTDLLIESIRKVHAGEIWLDSRTTQAVVWQFVADDKPPPQPAPLPPASQARDRDGSPLSQREREIAALVAQGLKNKGIAEKMFITEQTVKNHLHTIFDKLGVSDRLELARYALHHNLRTGRYIRSRPRIGAEAWRTQDHLMDGRCNHPRGSKPAPAGYGWRGRNERYEGRYEGRA